MKENVKRLKYYLFFSAVIIILIKILFSAIEPSIKVDEKVFLPVVFPEAASFSEKKSAPEAYEALDSHGDIIGYCFNTYDIAPEIRGYAGPISVLAGVNTGGTVTGISVISHNETAIYMQKLTDEKFYDQFRFKKISDGFILDRDLDGVTHATVSAAAIAKSVYKSAAMIANSRLGMNIPLQEDGGITKREYVNAAVLLILSIAGVAMFLTKRANTFSSMKTRGTLITGCRDLLLIVVIAFVGFYKSSPISITNVINLAYLRLPDLSHLFFYVLIGGFFIVTILFGRVYCGYLCPFGALVEFVEKIKTKKIKTYDRDLVVIKYIFLWAVLLIVLNFDRVEISSFEPYLALFSANRNMYMWTALIVILIFSLFHKRIWCRYFCAVGAFCALVTRIAPFRAGVPKNCDSCGACNDVCPVEIDFKDIEHFPHEECIACRKCHEYCINKRKT